MSFQPQRPHYPKAPQRLCVRKAFISADKYSALFSLTRPTSDLGGEHLCPWVGGLSLFIFGNES